MFVLFVIVIAFLPWNTDACSGTFTASSGTLQSPGFPFNYTNNLDCVYVIMRPVGERITLTFTQLDLQGACNQDFLEIRDGGLATSPLMSTLCGTNLETPKRSFQNTMYIRFRTDATRTGTGFRVNFAAAVVPEKFFLIPATIRAAIFRIDMDTISNVAIPGLSLLNPIAVDFDPVGRRVYWTDVGLKVIGSANLDGTGQTFIRVLNAAAIPDGLAVDPLSRLVFYTDTGNDVIAVMTMSGSLHRSIISSGLDQPRAIVLDTMKGVMFWTDWGLIPKIERANYDGTDRRTITTGFLIAPNAVALDLQAQRIYWIDAGTDWVEYSDLDGNGRTQLHVFPGRHFFGLAYYSDNLYVTDWTGTGSNTNVSAIHKLGTKVLSAETIGSGFFRMNDITIYAPDAWEKGPNGCGNNNGGCSYLCVPLPGKASKCMCPDAPTICVESKATTPKPTTTTTSTTTPRPTTTTVRPTTTTPRATTTINTTIRPTTTTPRTTTTTLKPTTTTTTPKPASTTTTPKTTTRLWWG